MTQRRRTADPGPDVRLQRYKRPGELDVSPSGAPRRDDRSSDLPPDVAGFGMRLFLASLTVVFASTFVAYGIMRWRNRATWESVIDGREIATLAAATVLLVVADICAMRAYKRAATRALATRLTVVGAVAASIYLVVQMTSWLPIWARRDPITGGDLQMPDVVFLMVTFAHAMHVAGGIVANLVVLAAAKRRGSGPTRTGLRLLYQYWRFLTVMWIGVLVLLAI